MTYRYTVSGGIPIMIMGYPLLPVDLKASKGAPIVPVQEFTVLAMGLPLPSFRLH